MSNIKKLRDKFTQESPQKKPEEGADIHYCLFELGPSVVKSERYIFYDRDQKNHQWIKDGEWMRRFEDGAYDVLEIDYDEEHEQISNPRLIKGHSMGKWHKKILNGEIPMGKPARVENSLPEAAAESIRRRDMQEFKEELKKEP